MKKAVITKEQEDAIEFIKRELWDENEYWDDELQLASVIDIVVNGGYKQPSNKTAFPVNNMKVSDLVLAWNGYYEVEKTPEQLVIEKIKKLEGNICTSSTELKDYEIRGFIYGVNFMNDTFKLGLKLD